LHARLIFICDPPGKFLLTTKYSITCSQQGRKGTAPLAERAITHQHGFNAHAVQSLQPSCNEFCFGDTLDAWEHVDGVNVNCAPDISFVRSYSRAACCMSRPWRRTHLPSTHLADLIQAEGHIQEQPQRAVVSLPGQVARPQVPGPRLKPGVFPMCHVSCVRRVCPPQL
jgi:hypothetical protein